MAAARGTVTASPPVCSLSCSFSTTIPPYHHRRTDCRKLLKKGGLLATCGLWMRGTIDALASCQSVCAPPACTRNASKIAAAEPFFCLLHRQGLRKERLGCWSTKDASIRREGAAWQVLHVAV